MTDARPEAPRLTPEAIRRHLVDPYAQGTFTPPDLSDIPQDIREHLLHAAHAKAVSFYWLIAIYRAGKAEVYALRAALATQQEAARRVTCRLELADEHHRDAEAELAVTLERAEKAEARADAAESALVTQREITDMVRSERDAADAALTEARQERDALERRLRYYEGESRDYNRQRIARLETALDWMVHLHHGVGKAGTAPSDDEWRDAITSAKAALDASPTGTAPQLETPHGPACPHGGVAGACPWCDLRDDGGLPEARPTGTPQEG